MSIEHPECPLVRHEACKDIDLPSVCAIVREDKKCLRKHMKSTKERIKNKDSKGD